MFLFCRTISTATKTLFTHFVHENSSVMSTRILPPQIYLVFVAETNQLKKNVTDFILKIKPYLSTQLNLCTAQMFCFRTQCLQNKTFEMSRTKLFDEGLTE